MSSASRILTLALACTLTMGTFALAGCNSSKDDATSNDQAAQTEQDNCYGDDLPVINNG